MRILGFFLVCAAALSGQAAAQATTLPYDHIHLNEPRPLRLANGTTIYFAYVEGPAGTKIETGTAVGEKR